MKNIFSKTQNAPSPEAPFYRSFKFLASVGAILAIGLFAGSGYYWYQNVFTNPDRILSDVLTKSLQTSSVDRTVTQEGGQNKVSQAMHVGFTPAVLAQSVTNLEEETSLGKTTVTTETIGTKNTDYVRYNSIEIANNSTANDRFDGIVNTWAKRDAKAEQGEAVSFLSDALFVAVPFGNFNASQRTEIKNEIKKVDLYKTNESKMSWQGGRPVMEYTMTLSPQALVQVLAKYSALSGVGNPADFNQSQYEGASDITVKINVDVLSRHINKIDYVGSNRVETYGAYNSGRTIDLPTKTIGIDELQAKVSGAEEPAAPANGGTQQ